MRGVAGFVAVAAASMAAGASPAQAQDDVPGPFVCMIGESQVVLSANADATRYAGELEPAGGYDGVDTGEPPLVTLVQKYAGWRTVYQNSRTTMAIEGDAAKLYGAFGVIDCFASRSVPVGEGWEGGEPAEPEEPEEQL